LKSLRGKFFITRVPGEFEEINLGYKHKDQSRNAYYTFDRTELIEKIIESGVYNEEQMKRIQKEGCKSVIGNGCCVSPFSGYKYYLAKNYSLEIIKGLKILMEAIAPDSTYILAPKNQPEITNFLRQHIEKSPNVSMITLNDYYPLGLVEVLYKRLSNYTDSGDYFPGKEEILIIPIEDLLRIYLHVEEPESANFIPVMLITESKNLFIWVDKECKISELLNRVGISENGSIIKGDLLRGRTVTDPQDEEIGDTSQIFVLAEQIFEFNKCICCGKCSRVCPKGLKYAHARASLSGNRGILPYIEVKGCSGCGLCGYFCPQW
jgi:Na+-translocating ferredoxin:NAD+ oxidoreductase RnfC subunit